MSKTAPSLAWRRDIFESPPRRDIDKTSKSTTRFPIFIPTLNRYAIAEGGNQATAIFLLKFLQRNGYVTRFKEEPFALEELGGPAKRVPDLLVELSADDSLHVVECKAKRFLTAEVLARFDIARLLLEPLEFCFHIWTDRDHLANPVSETVRMIDRGFTYPAPTEIFKQIQTRASTATSLRPLINEFGWDDTLAALAHGAFFINALEKIHEDTRITHHFSASDYDRLFARRPVPRSWWDTLAVRPPAELASCAA